MRDLPPYLSRRSLLQRSALGLGALGLGTLLAEQGAFGAEGPDRAGGEAMAVKPPHFPAKAKRVIHFFLNGGPSQVDTFDPKPALEKYAGKPAPHNLTTERKTGAAFPSPFKFKKYGQSGIEVSELFARTAEHVDDIAVIRSMYAQVPNHEPSLMLMNCGEFLVLTRPSRLVGHVRAGLGESESAGLHVQNSDKLKLARVTVVNDANGQQRNKLYPLQVGFKKYGQSGIEMSDWVPHIGGRR